MKKSRAEVREWMIENLGIESPTNLQITAYLNDQKEVEIEVTEKVTKDVQESYKDYVKPDDAKKLHEEIEALKDSSAKVVRLEAYKKAGINTDDEDILSIVETKFKGSKELEKDLAEYAKAHPSFLKAKEEIKEKKETTEENTPVVEKEQDNKPAEELKQVKAIGGIKGNPTPNENKKVSYREAVAERYSQQK